MQSRSLSAVIAVALVAAAVVLFVVLRDGGDDGEQAATQTTTAAGGTATGEQKQKQKQKQQGPKPVTLVVRGGEPAGGVKQLTYTRGERVLLRVRSDVADEVHVHGYDLFEDVGPSKNAKFSFPADIEGGFEVELEGSHTQLAELTVKPG